MVSQPEVKRIYVCSDGDCKDRDVQEEERETHRLYHGMRSLEKSMGAIQQDLREFATDLSQRPDVSHAHVADILENAKECPACAAALPKIKETFIEEWKAAQPPTPEPTPVVDPEPEPEPEPEPPSEPRVLLFENTQLPANTLRLRSYGVEAQETPEGSVQLRVADEAQGAEAVEAEVVPACRWVKRDDGWFYACEPE